MYFTYTCITFEGIILNYFNNIYWVWGDDLQLLLNVLLKNGSSGTRSYEGFFNQLLLKLQKNNVLF